jgi:rhodanese-related sulfurtransferase
MQLVRRNTYILAALLVLLALFGAAHTAAFAQEATVEAAFDIQPVLENYLATLPDGFYGVRPDAAFTELNSDAKPFLIDLREAKEVADGGYIAGAVLIPVRSLTQNLDKLPAQDQPIIVYCGIGHRGAIATEVLHLLGYTNVRSLSGGFNGWKAAGLPVVTGEIAAPAPSGAPAPTFDAALFEQLDSFLTDMPDDFYAISPTNALRSLSESPAPFLIDVRGAQELKDSGYIEGQVNIPLRSLLDDLGNLPADKDQPILVYCAVGHRGAMAMTTLELLGYTNVKSIGGGFNNWVKGGLPIVQPASS